MVQPPPKEASAPAGPSDRPKRRRRRKRKPRADDGANAASPPASSAAPQKSPVDAPKRERPHDSAARKKTRRRKKGTLNTPPSPVQLVERVTKSDASHAETPSDRPLSPNEVAEYRRHFAFLKDYRRALKLKLNAQEDLLLNGAKDPDRRGVCQHLLSKVDYATVSAAAERLPKEERPRLVGGVLGFKDDMAFLLLYLESLKEAGHGDATRALEEALQRIDFRSVSEGQMRRVMELVAELFDEARRSSVLLGLLASRSFHSALDQSLAKLPQPLAQDLSAVLALHEHVVLGRTTVENEGALQSGLELALRDGLEHFARSSARVRARLLELLARLVPEGLRKKEAAVNRLLEGLDLQGPERAELELLLAIAWLRLGLDGKADRRLAELQKAFPRHDGVLAMVAALQAPRIAAFAILKGGLDAPVAHVNEGFALLRRAPVWLRISSAAEREAAIRHSEIHDTLCIPQVAPIAESGEQSGRRFFVVERRGEALLQGHRALRDRTTALDVLAQAARLLNALRVAGFTLPDANLRRFEIAPGDVLTLVNTWGMRPATDEDGASLLHSLVHQMGSLRALSRADAETAKSSESLPGLATALHQLRWSSQ